jgi:hypothetical protein
MLIKPTPEHPISNSRRMAPNVSDLMLLIVAAAVSAALIKLHTEDATLKFRLTNHPPASVWTRLFIGHSLTASGLIFGISRLYLLWRKRLADKSFGHWFWIVISLYLLLYISASLLWAFINLVKNGAFAGLNNINQSLGRVFILTSQQACFDQFAWFIAGVWISFRLLHLPNDAGQILEPPGNSQKSDHSIAIYCGLVIASTIFQRFIESAGF